MTIYEGHNHILIHTEHNDPQKHSHKAAHIIVSLEEEIFVSTDEDSFTCRGVIIPSGTYHCIDSGRNSLLVFMYDAAMSLSNDFHSVRIVSDAICNIVAETYNHFTTVGTKDGYWEFYKNTMELLNLSGSISKGYDDRIQKALEYLRDRTYSKITCKEVASAVYLSESRFSHLFRTQVGMSFSTYVVYQRILLAYKNIFQGMSITDAAIHAGFTGSTHFADVNRRVFGLPASYIRKNFSYIKLT